MGLPFVVLVWLNSSNSGVKPQQNFSDALKKVLAGAIIFSITITIGFAVLYQSIRLPHIFNQVLIEMPRKINANTVLLSLGTDSLKSLLAFIGLTISTMYLFLGRYQNNVKKYKVWIFQLVVISLGLLSFVKIGNLSRTPALILFPIVVIILYFKKLNTITNQTKLFFFVMSCYQFVLIPYPNVNFHIMIFVIAFFILIRDKYAIHEPKKMRRLLGFPVILVSLLLIHEAKTIDLMRTYSFEEVQFKSGSGEWQQAIVEAKNANGELEFCSSYGCKMLILFSKKG
jgi:hypothetical protein